MPLTWPCTELFRIFGAGLRASVHGKSHGNGRADVEERRLNNHRASTMRVSSLNFSVVHLKRLSSHPKFCIDPIRYDSIVIVEIMLIA